MPAMITHAYLAERVLSRVSFDIDHDSFLLGAQGPDILFFFRAYPWLFGENGLPLGNALHEVQPSYLIDTMIALVKNAPAQDKRILTSYLQGFLCHYATDRTLHPFVCSRQTALARQIPSYASVSQPYHYRFESAIDTLILHDKMHGSLTTYSLRCVIPRPQARRDQVLASFYHRLLLSVLQTDISKKKLNKLTADMRHSMWLMTDHIGFKRMMFRALEAVTRRGAWYSSLIRTKHIDDFDYANVQHQPWSFTDVTRQDDVFTMCDEAEELALCLIMQYQNGSDGITLTDDIDFSGCHYLNGGE